MVRSMACPSNLARAGPVGGGADVEPCHLVHHLIARGEDYDGRLLFLTEPAQHLDSVEAGQHDVQNDEIEIVVERRVERLAPVGAYSRVVALVL